ncbi:MAG: hypothetical protein KDD82_01555, partial [Planctomycetes bacterium]|nr:hypothetical protein [Planctomycetota bacterium]
MRSLVVWVWVGAAAVAAADVVHLTSGRSVRGDVISETETEVVVRVAGSGRLTFPRKLVREIERESPGATRLSLARQRSREGAWDEALRLYRAAA